MGRSLENMALLLVDDDQTQLDALSGWLGAFGHQVVTAVDAAFALTLLETNQFDVILTDLAMPGMSGLQLLAIVKERFFPTQVVFLSGQGTMDDAIAALREGGAYDFLRKPVYDFQQLHQVLKGALHRRQQLVLLDHVLAQGGKQTSPEMPGWLANLNPSERETLRLLGAGLDNRAIADRLGLSPKTIGNRLTRIFQKLDVPGRSQAIVLAQGADLR